MLDAFIIEEIRRRERDEEERCRDGDRPWLEIPIAPDGPLQKPAEEEGERSERGVIVIDFCLS